MSCAGASVGVYHWKSTGCSLLSCQRTHQSFLCQTDSELVLIHPRNDIHSFPPVLPPADPTCSGISAQLGWYHPHLCVDTPQWSASLRDHHNDEQVSCDLSQHSPLPHHNTVVYRGPRDQSSKLLHLCIMYNEWWIPVHMMMPLISPSASLTLTSYFHCIVSLCCRYWVLLSSNIVEQGNMMVEPVFTHHSAWVTFVNCTHWLTDAEWFYQGRLLEIQWVVFFGFIRTILTLWFMFSCIATCSNSSINNWVNHGRNVVARSKIKNS